MASRTIALILNADPNKAIGAFRKAGQASTRMGKQATDAAQKTSRSFRNATSSVTKFGDKLGLTGKLAVIAGGAVSAAFGTKAITNAAKLEKQLSEVATLLPDLTSKGFGELREEVMEFSRVTGVATDDVVPALYQAISAGVPQENVFQFMTVASRAATGGVTDLETAVDGLTSVVNAYGAENVPVAKAADILFTAVRFGKTNFEQLSGTIAKVMPLAASMKLKIEDVAAAFTTVTTAGVPTAEAMTQVRAMMQSLAAPTVRSIKLFEELGIEVSASRLANEGFLPTIREIKEATGGNESLMRRLFGTVEGLNAALILTNNEGKKYNEVLAGMYDAGGAADLAFSRMAESTSRLWTMIKTNLNNALTVLGYEILPYVQSALAALLPVLQNQVVPAFRMMGEAASKVIEYLSHLSKVETIAVAALGAIFAALVVLPPLFGLVAKAALAAWTAIGGPIGLVVAALVGLGLVVYRFRRNIANYLLEAARFVLENFAKPVVDALLWVSQIYTKILKVITFGKVDLEREIGKIFDFIGGKIDEWDRKNEAAMDKISSDTITAMGGIGDAVTPMVSSVELGFGDVALAADGAATSVGTSMDATAGAVEGAADRIAKAAAAAVASIKSLIAGQGELNAVDASIASGNIFGAGISDPVELARVLRESGTQGADKYVTGTADNPTHVTGAGGDSPVVVGLSDEAESLFDAWSGKNELQQFHGGLIDIYNSLNAEVQATTSLADFIERATAEEEMDRLALNDGVTDGFEYLAATTNSVIDELQRESDKRDAHDQEEMEYWETSLGLAKEALAIRNAEARATAMDKVKSGFYTADRLSSGHRLPEGLSTAQEYWVRHYDQQGLGGITEKVGEYLSIGGNHYIAPDGTVTYDIPEAAEGGIVRARPGGTIVRVGEAGQDEAIVPLDSANGIGGTQVTNNFYFQGDLYGLDNIRSRFTEWLNIDFARGSVTT